jgi:hypothetical protein
VDFFFRKREWCGINGRKRIDCRLPFPLLPGASKGSEMMMVVCAKELTMHADEQKVRKRKS